MTPNAATWSAIGSSRSVVDGASVRSTDGTSSHGIVCIARPTCSPMRSMSPDASVRSVVMSMSWYFSDEEPELTTRMSLTTHRPPGSR